MRRHHEREGLIWEADLPQGEKLALLAINTFSDAEGRCWPGQKRIAAMCGCARETANRYIQGLKDKSLIVIEGVHRDSKGQASSNDYRIDFDALDAFVNQASGGCDNSSLTPVINDHRGCDNSSLTPVINDHTNRSIGTDPEKDLDRSRDRAQQMSILPPDASTTVKVESSPVSNEELDREFEEEFWPQAFRKVSKPAARQAYRKARKGSKNSPPTSKDEIMQSWEYANTELWPEKERREKEVAERMGRTYTPKEFVPHPSTWLNGERWKDEEYLPKTTSQSEEERALDVGKEIARHQKRLGIVGQPPKMWRERTGCLTVGDMSLEQKQAYLRWLKEQEV